MQSIRHKAQVVQGGFDADFGVGRRERQFLVIETRKPGAVLAQVRNFIRNAVSRVVVEPEGFIEKTRGVTPGDPVPDNAGWNILFAFRKRELPKHGSLIDAPAFAAPLFNLFTIAVGVKVSE